MTASEAARLPALACAAALSVACGLGAAPDMASCEDIGDPGAKATCRGEAMNAIADDPAGMRQAIAVCSDPTTRDLLRLELVADDPELSLELCPTMEGAEAKRWCTTLEGRSHLWKTGDQPGDKQH
jgi:hypothetical protein